MLIVTGQNAEPNEMVEIYIWVLHPVVLCGKKDETAYLGGDKLILKFLLRLAREGHSPPY